MKLKSIKLHRVDTQGTELDIFDYKILKIINSTAEMMIYENT